MNSLITGIHHVTAICGDPRVNHQFYTGVLGLRLVKQTVNFDNPNGQHLYYADGAGTPGSVLTFFPMTGMPQGREGTGQVSAVAFGIAAGALDYWQQRLAEKNVSFRGPMQRFDEVYLAFEDPDGLKLELVVAPPSPAFQPWSGTDVPEAMQLRGIHSVTLTESGYELTQALLTHQMGWTLLRDSGGRQRYQAPGAGPSSFVDIVCEPAGRHGLDGIGAVHHVAFRVADDAAERTWRDALIAFGHQVSPIKDRGYFHSIYYREPGGVLFEIATDTPGFATDESLDTLGSQLKLPARFEPLRQQLERRFPVLNAPAD